MEWHQHHAPIAWPCLFSCRHRIGDLLGRAVAAVLHSWNIKPPCMSFLVMGLFCRTQARHQLHAQPGRAGGGCHARLVARRRGAARRHLMVWKRLQVGAECRSELGRALSLLHTAGSPRLWSCGSPCSLFALDDKFLLPLPRSASAHTRTHTQFRMKSGRLDIWRVCSPSWLCVYCIVTTRVLKQTPVPHISLIARSDLF